MKIALANPPFSKLVYGNERTIKSVTPCLGLFYMQSYCNDIAEIEVFEGEFFDSQESLIKAINRFSPDVLGVTTNTTTWPLCIELAQKVRAATKIAGGPYSAFRINESLRYFDAVCVGDGEVSLRDLIEQKDYRKARGFAWRNKFGLPEYSALAPLLDLDEFAHPNQSAMQIGLYQASPHRELPSPFTTMVTSRGCGFACTFCLSASGGLNGGRYRVRSVANVVKEVRNLREIYGIRSIQFWDDTFTMRKERTRELCSALALEGIKYVCNTRTDKIDEETATLLASSGCVGVFFGIESGSERILEADHKKGVVNRQVESAFRLCAEAGIRTTASFIFGSIDDDDRTIEETIEFSLSLNPDYVLYNIYTAHPGTSGYRRAIEEKIIGEYSVNLSAFTGEPVGVPTVCRKLTRNQLLCKKAEAYVRFYRNKRSPKYNELIATYERELEQLATLEA